MRKQVSVLNHPLFPTQKTTARARLIMAEKLGRVLLTSEHVHHKDEDVSNDDPDNLELLTSLEHHRLHKKGVPRPDVAEMRRGTKHSPESIAKMKNLSDEQRANRARAGAISGGKPKPWLKGRPLSEEHREKVRQAALRRWERKRDETRS